MFPSLTVQNFSFQCGDSHNTTISSSQVCDFIRDCPETYLDESYCGKLDKFTLYCLYILASFLCVEVKVDLIEMWRRKECQSRTVSNQVEILTTGNTDNILILD